MLPFSNSVTRRARVSLHSWGGEIVCVRVCVSSKILYEESFEHGCSGSHLLTTMAY